MNNHHYVIGIAGGSASGKSTFADALARALSLAEPTLPVTIFRTDQYAVPNAPGAPTFVSPSTSETMFDWNHPETVDAARMVADVDAWTEMNAVPSVAIVEGLMVLHRVELRSLCDLKVFVELEADLRALRRMLRDMKTKANRDPEYIARYYRECARVGHERYVEPSRVYADVIIRGDADFERTAGLLSTIALSALGVGRRA